MAIDQSKQMSSTFPDIARIQPTQEFLNIILKNTHFNDDLLKDSAKTKLHISYYFPIPVAMIRFAEAFYDFILPLRLSEKDLSVSKWLQQPTLTIRLVLSDPVITDQLSAVSFQFDKNESDLLRKHISRLAELTELQLDLIENEIRANTNSLLS